MNIATLYKTLVTLAAAGALAACGGGSPSGEVEPADGEIQYAPLNGLLPSPNDLAFQGSNDGTLNNTGNTAVDSVDGFSTNTSATLTATEPLEQSSINGGGSVRVFAVTTTATGTPVSSGGTEVQPNDPSSPGPVPVASIDRELSAGTEYRATLSSADRNGRTLAITPLTPLATDQTYMVVVTNGVQEQGGGSIDASQQYSLAKGTSSLVDGSGNSTVDSLTDKEAQTLEPVRQLVNSQVGVTTSATGIAREDIVASWTFTTQTTGPSLSAVRSEIQSSTIGFGSLTFARDTPNPSGSSAGEVYAGGIGKIPYYLEEGDSDPTKVRTGFWTQSDGSILTPGNPQPAENATINVPVLVAIPKDNNANDVVIFQHGITSNRTAMLGIANALTSQGQTVIAIDLPLHGITDTSSGLYAGDLERTFNVDLVDNDGSNGPDNKIDPSGEHFINLASLQTSRDNLRQAVADLFAVTRAVRVTVAAGSSAADLDGDGDADLTNNISFVGHSLGGIVGIPYAAHETNLDAAVFGMAGSGIAKLLDGSPNIGPEIEKGLEAKGLTKGTPAYEQFLGAAQTVIDSGDPANYAATVRSNHNTLSLEVVGGSSSQPDQTVPNFVDPSYPGASSDTIPSPTAGTDPLSRLLTGSPVNQINSPPGSAGDYLIRYTAGKHASLLDPNAGSSAATSEMQTNVATFLKSDGTNVTFTGSGTVASP